MFLFLPLFWYWHQKIDGKPGSGSRTWHTANSLSKLSSKHVTVLFCCPKNKIEQPLQSRRWNHSPLCGTGSTHVWYLQSILIHLFVSVSSVSFFWMSWIINLLKTFLLIPLNLLSCKKTSTNPSFCLFLLSGCCPGWVNSYGPTGSGFLKATAGPTWRTTMERCSPNQKTSGQLCPLVSASWSSGSYLKGDLASESLITVHFNSRSLSLLD